MKNKKKRHPIPKTLRGKRRYVVVRFFSRQPLDRRQVVAGVQEALLLLFGSAGVAQQKLVFRDFFPSVNVLVLQCNAAFEKQVGAGLLLVQKIGGQRVVPKIVLKTGAIQKALDFAENQP